MSISIDLTRRLGRPLLALAGVAVLAACGGGEEKAADPAAEDFERALPAGFTELPANAQIALPAAARPACGTVSTRIVFRSAFEWESFWRGNTPDCGVPGVPQSLDWTKEMLAFVALGERKNAEDRVNIVGRRESADSVVVLVRRTTLQEGCRGTPAVSFPRALVRLPRDERAVRFTEEHRKLPC
jgi:hypothetical protein